MTQDEVPKVNSINISTDPKELDWDKMMIYISDRELKKGNDNLLLPALYESRLKETLIFHMTAFLHLN